MTDDEKRSTYWPTRTATRSRTECSRPFASLYAARAHIQTHRKDNNLKFICNICGAWFIIIVHLYLSWNIFHFVNQLDKYRRSWNRTTVPRFPDTTAAAEVHRTCALVRDVRVWREPRRCGRSDRNILYPLSRSGKRWGSAHFAALFYS